MRERAGKTVNAGTGFLIESRGWPSVIYFLIFNCY